MSIKNETFLDKNFKPNIESILNINKDINKIGNKNKIEWFRIKEFYKNQDYYLFKDFDSNSIVQGQLDNHYLISTLCCIAEFKNGFLIKRIFKDNLINNNSIYGIWFYVDGIWKQIIIDDFIPFFNNENKIDFIFSHTSNKEIWVTFLEKALAKHKKNFINLNEGKCEETLELLTGAESKVIIVENETKIWEKLKKCFYNGYLLTCLTKSKEEKNIKFNGLFKDFLYMILDVREITLEDNSKEKLLKIKNSWKNIEWNGDWSDNSDKWTEELKEELNLKQLDDGIFWINYNDFCKIFLKVIVNKIKNNMFYNGIEYIEKNNTITKLFCENDSKIELTINQFHEMNYDENHKYCYYRINFIKIKYNKLKLVKSKLSNKKIIKLKLNIKKGQYIILAQKYENNSYKQSFNLSLKSNNIIHLQDIIDHENLFNEIEYFSWKNKKFEDKEYEKKSFEEFDVFDINNEYLDKLNYRILEFKNKKLEKNKKSEIQIQIQKLEGFEILNKIIDNSVYIHIEENKKDIILLKSNPLKERDENIFKLDFEYKGDFILQNNESLIINYLKDLKKDQKPNIKYIQENIEADCKCIIY